MHRESQGMRQDPEKAARWCRKAAEQGLDQAQLNLGLMYERGQGMKKSPKEAERWYRKAAEQGLVDAQWNLGWMYKCVYGHGEGVQQSFEEAVHYRGRNRAGRAQFFARPFCLGGASAACPPARFFWAGPQLPARPPVFLGAL